MSSIARKPAAISEPGRQILAARYLRKDGSGAPVETPEDLFERVAGAVAEAESAYGPDADVSAMAKRFYDLMADLLFLPNSPTLMNAGREMGQLSACFVLPVEDSIDQIFDTMKQAALIHKSGGGTGFGFSHIRPRGDLVSTSGGRSSGPVSFIRVFNEATEAINQGGFRRGANMAVLRVDHPDVEGFISAKNDSSQLTNFNMSVALTDRFMEAVERDADFPLVNPRTASVVREVKARELFDGIVDSAWRTGEPGILFIDRIADANPTPHAGAIESTNPCAEQPLLPYESCNLGSINLARLVHTGQLDWEKLGETIDIALRFLDDVIDVNRYPLPQIRRITLANRKIGLGLMGFADYLIARGIAYDSEEGLQAAEELMQFFSRRALEASRGLASERGAFPNFGDSVYGQRGDPPVRNASRTTMAPTGTLSLLAGCSGGIEPVYAFCYRRRIQEGIELERVHPSLLESAHRAGLSKEQILSRMAASGSAGCLVELPADERRVLVTAGEIAPEWHVRMQAVFQKHTDSAVSKTVNFPAEATREDVRKVFTLAYELGCKGVTVYRDQCRPGQVLQPGLPVRCRCTP